MHPRFQAQRFPAKPAAIMADTGEAISFGELEKLANQGAQLFRSLGLQAGDAVAIWMPNSLRYFEFYWAAQRSGLYIVTVSSALRGEEAAFIINDSGAKLLVTDKKIDGLQSFLSDHRSAAQGLSNIYWGDTEVPGVPGWSETLASFPTSPIDDESAGYHMVYSSGTTGRPKGVRMPLSGGPADVENPLVTRVLAQYGSDENDVYLSTAPLYHASPIFYTTAMQRTGATAVIMRKFDAEEALAAAAKFKATSTQMVPTMFVRLLRLSDAVRDQYDLSSLRTVIHAAAPCPVDIKQKMIDWLGPIIYEFYGGSEGNGSTFITSDEWLRKPGSVGRANWGTLHICGPDGEELDAGTPGLIYFEGGYDFSYLNDEEKTRESRHPDNWSWSTLGDIGYVDADGYLFLTDRKSFTIISGGVNVYPQEIENLLVSHPLIADVAVIGVPDPDMGEAVKAVVQTIDPADATPEVATAIIAFCREHLSSIKVPRSVDFDPELPRLDTGKLYKQVIRSRYWPSRDNQIP